MGVELADGTALCNLCGNIIVARVGEVCNTCSVERAVQNLRNAERDARERVGRSKGYLDVGKVRRRMQCQQCGQYYSGNPGTMFCTKSCEEDFDREQQVRREMGPGSGRLLVHPSCDGCGRKFKKAKKLTRVKGMDGEFRKFCSDECYRAFEKGLGYRVLWHDPERYIEPPIVSRRSPVIPEGYGDSQYHVHADGVKCTAPVKEVDTIGSGGRSKAWIICEAKSDWVINEPSSARPKVEPFTESDSLPIPNSIIPVAPDSIFLEEDIERRICPEPPLKSGPSIVNSRGWAKFTLACMGFTTWGVGLAWFVTNYL